MMGLADGKIEASESAKHHLDLCLDCRACEPACPSGVVYHELIEETRARLLKQSHSRFVDRVMRGIFFHVFVYPTRLKLALLPARVMQKVGLYSVLRKIGLFKLLPASLRKMEQMLPSSGSLWPRKLAARAPAKRIVAATPASPIVLTGKEATQASRLQQVAFFPGCIGSVLFAKVNQQAVDLLAACGVYVVVPTANTCCGAIHLHNGASDGAKEFAKKNIDAFLPPQGPTPDWIATTIAGCGAMLKEYDHLLRDDPAYAERAKLFVSKVQDISQVLVMCDLPEMKHAINETITYHDACHLAHAQRVTSEPRALLARVPGLKIVPLPESEICCGAAGTYNLEHPAMATELAERKLKNIAATGAKICATGNVGCCMQIQSEAAAHGMKITVVHPVELLHRAMFSE
jgi:glycolate oxidase iron-sulfur subunit